MSLLLAKVIIVSKVRYKVLVRLGVSSEAMVMHGRQKAPDTAPHQLI